MITNIRDLIHSVSLNYYVSRYLPIILGHKNITKLNYDFSKGVGIPFAIQISSPQAEDREHRDFSD